MRKSDATLSPLSRQWRRRETPQVFRDNLSYAIYQTLFESAWEISGIMTRMIKEKETVWAFEPRDKLLTELDEKKENVPREINTQIFDSFVRGVSASARMIRLQVKNYVNVRPSCANLDDKIGRSRWHVIMHLRIVTTFSHRRYHLPYVFMRRVYKRDSCLERARTALLGRDNAYYAFYI